MFSLMLFYKTHYFFSDFCFFLGGERHLTDSMTCLVLARPFSRGTTGKKSDENFGMRFEGIGAWGSRCGQGSIYTGRSVHLYRFFDLIPPLADLGGAAFAGEIEQLGNTDFRFGLGWTPGDTERKRGGPEMWRFRLYFGRFVAWRSLGGYWSTYLR